MKYLIIFMFITITPIPPNPYLLEHVPKGKCIEGTEKCFNNNVFTCIFNEWTLDKRCNKQTEVCDKEFIFCKEKVK